MTKFYINGFSFFKGDVPPESFSPYVQVRQLRRMEQIAKNALFCAYEALEQAKLPLNEPKNMGLSVAVSSGALENTCKFMDSILEDGDALSSPTAFAGSVHNSTGLALSLFLHPQGPCVTTGQFEFSFPAALQSALCFLEKKMCENVLVVLADDINRVAQTYAPTYPDLFYQVLRAPQGPFERQAAAFVVSRAPGGAHPFELTQVDFSYTGTGEFPPVVSCETFAQQVVELLAADRAFTCKDSFGGVQFILEAKPYVKP